MKYIRIADVIPTIINSKLNYVSKKQEARKSIKSDIGKTKPKVPCETYGSLEIARGANQPTQLVNHIAMRILNPTVELGIGCD